MAAPLSCLFVCRPADLSLSLSPPLRSSPTPLPLQPEDEWFHYSDKFWGGLSLLLLAPFTAKLFTCQEEGLYSGLMKKRLDLDF